GLNIQLIIAQVLSVKAGSRRYRRYAADYEAILVKRTTVRGQNAAEHDGGHFRIRQDYFMRNGLWPRDLDTRKIRHFYLIAAGGGGDSLGAIHHAVLLKQLLPDSRITIVVPNLKRALEQPVPGPIPMEYLRYNEGSLVVCAGARHFYNIGRGLSIQIPGKRAVALSEGMVYNALQKASIDMVFVDASQSGAELARDFCSWNRDAINETFCLFIDMGGDVLARFPYPITDENRTHHPERCLRSPCTDLLFLNMAMELKAAMGNRVMVAVAALGGDAEFGSTLFGYLRDLFKSREIVAVLDNVRFVSQYCSTSGKYWDLMKLCMAFYYTEVSGNFIARILAVTDKIDGMNPQVQSSYKEKYDGWAAVYRKRKWDRGMPRRALFEAGIMCKELPVPLSGRTIRNGTRIERLPWSYLVTIVLDPGSLYRRIVMEQMRNAKLTWFEEAEFLAAQGYMTELSDREKCAPDTDRDGGIFMGAQNMFYKDAGPYTGEVSPSMLLREQVAFVMVGHPERTHGVVEIVESYELVNKKVKAALAHGLIPAIFVSDTLDERKRGVTNEVLINQLSTALQGIGRKQAQKVIVIYLPLWVKQQQESQQKAIDPAEAQAVCRTLRTWLARNKRYGPRIARKIYLMYGRYVNADNAADYLGQPDIDGVFVARFAMPVESAAGIVLQAAAFAEKKAKKPFVIFNLKMFEKGDCIMNYYRGLKKGFANTDAVDVVVCPTFLDIPYLSMYLEIERKSRAEKEAMLKAEQALLLPNRGHIADDGDLIEILRRLSCEKEIMPAFIEELRAQFSRDTLLIMEKTFREIFDESVRDGKTREIVFETTHDELPEVGFAHDKVYIRSVWLIHEYLVHSLPIQHIFDALFASPLAQEEKNRIYDSFFTCANKTAFMYLLLSMLGYETRI
ncbi:MAG TPA: triose-phosphate isomerase, partial [Candidatus Omnitrophota bacterium]|nr:triose-phosphate isomerase [Candidatus Omnitrophota bacterium]